MVARRSAIVFFGTPAVRRADAASAARRRATRSCGVVTQPDRPRGRGQKVTDAPVKALALRARPAGRSSRQRCATPDVVDDARARGSPTSASSPPTARSFPTTLLALPRLGMINVHASLLPKYRGAAPVHRAVIDGEHETGVTIMRVVQELDAGADARQGHAADRPRRDERRRRARPRASWARALLVDVVDRLAAGTATRRAAGRHAVRPTRRG